MVLPLEGETTTAEIVWKKLPWELPPPKWIEYRDLDGQVIKREEQTGDRQSIPVSIAPPAVECWIMTGQ
jgi:hypothetical protein